MSSGYVEFTLKFSQWEDQWVGSCLELNYSTQADTLEEARADIQAIVQDLMEIHAEEGDLEEYLFLHGVIPEPTPVDPQASSIERHVVQVVVPSPAESPAGG